MLYSAMSATFGRVHCAPPLVAFPQLSSTSKSNSLFRICQSPKRAARSAATIKAELDIDGFYARYPQEEEIENHHNCTMTIAKPLPKAEMHNQRKREAKQIMLLYKTSEESYRFTVGSGNWFLAVTAPNLGIFSQLTQALIKAIQTEDKVDYIERDKDYLQVIQGHLQFIVPKKNFRLYQEPPQDNNIVWEPETYTEIEMVGGGKKKLVCFDENSKILCNTCRRSVIIVRSQIEGSLILV